MLVSLMFPFTLAGTYTEAQRLCRTLENNAKCKCGVKVYISLWNTSKLKLTKKNVVGKVIEAFKVLHHQSFEIY